MNVQTNATTIFTTNKLIQNSRNIMCEYLSSKGKHIPKFDAKLGRYAIKMLESDVARGALHFHTHTHTHPRALARAHIHTYWLLIMCCAGCANRIEQCLHACQVGTILLPR